MINTIDTKYTAYVIIVGDQKQYVMSRTPLMRMIKTWTNFDRTIGEFHGFKQLTQLLMDSEHVDHKKATKIAKAMYDEYFW